MKTIENEKKNFKKQSIRDAALCEHYLYLPNPKIIESLLQKTIREETIQEIDFAIGYFNFSTVREVR